MSRLSSEPWVLNESDFQAADIRRAQEWLWLAGHRIEVDGVDGPATRTALRDFAARRALSPDLGDPDLRRVLSQSIGRALGAEVREELGSFRAAIFRAAYYHLAEAPREVGGDNRGPWVRLYDHGQEGRPWCASFVSFLLRQAAEASGIAKPILGSPSCDDLAEQARTAGRLLVCHSSSRLAAVAPGDLFFIRKGASDRVHVGVVVELRGDVFGTIEGNTNPNGGREGYEVERRYRSFGPDKDFVLLG